MFGDFFATSGQLVIDRGASQLNFPGGVDVTFRPTNVFADAPLAGGARHFKASENNMALPDDRVYFLYNHFHNALAAQNNAAMGLVTRRNANRYTFGFEKTICDGFTSIEFRLPVSGTFDFQSFDGESAVNVQGGMAGNLAILVKHL